MAVQMIADYYGCDTALLNNAEALAGMAHSVVHAIGAEIVSECVHSFTPIGVSYIAVITTSHFSIHT